MSIIASKTCAAKSAAKIAPFFELHNTFSTLFSLFVDYKASTLAMSKWTHHDVNPKSFCPTFGVHIMMQREQLLSQHAIDQCRDIADAHLAISVKVGSANGKNGITIQEAVDQQGDIAHRNESISIHIAHGDF